MHDTLDLVKPRTAGSLLDAPTESVARLPASLIVVLNLEEFDVGLIFIVHPADLEIGLVLVFNEIPEGISLRLILVTYLEPAEVGLILIFRLVDGGVCLVRIPCLQKSL